ncbi:MAG: undecaprenyl diphosphate synthase family protein [Methanolobus sp.]
MSVVTSYYEKYLLQQIEKYPRPQHVSLVISEADLLRRGGYKKLRDYIIWSNQLGIDIVSIYVDVLDTEEELKTEMVEQVSGKIHEILHKIPDEPGYEIFVEKGKTHSKRKKEGFQIYVSVGFGGREEVTNAVRDILKKVKDGKIKPAEITENMIESRLVVKHEPDILIRSGGKHLSDFLIWQSIYSEYYFTDVNWHDVRKLDLLRIIRDFQKRQRRFGE